MVNVREQNGLREGGFDVFSRTPITMPAGSDLEIVVVRVGFLIAPPRTDIALPCSKRNSSPGPAQCRRYSPIIRESV